MVPEMGRVTINGTALNCNNFHSQILFLNNLTAKVFYSPMSLLNFGVRHLPLWH